MLALYPLWRKARRVYSLTSRLPGTNRLGFQPSLALSGGFERAGCKRAQPVRCLPETCRSSWGRSQAYQSGRGQYQRR
ncbi:MAG: hypothetical protein ABW170_08895 [Candidatus Thiodiazotropha sp. L084R]